MAFKTTGLLRGSAGINKGEEISKEAALKKEQRKKDGGDIYRYWLSKGETKEIIILDSSIEDIPFRWEHNIKGPDGSWGNIEPCLQVTDVCPLCESGQSAYYAMYLTVIDTSGYTSKKTGKTIPYTKRLLVVKRGQQKDFLDILQIANKKHGTIRGVSMLLERGNEEKSASIGSPRIDEDGDMFKILPEEDIKEYYGHAEVRNKDGEIVKEADADIHSYQYETFLAVSEQEAESVKARHGGRPLEGSDSYNKQSETLAAPTAPPTRPRRGNAPEASSPTPEANEAKASTGTRSRSRTNRKPVVAEVDEEVFED